MVCERGYGQSQRRIAEAIAALESLYVDSNVPDDQKQLKDGVTPTKDTTIELSKDETFVLEVEAKDKDLPELEVVHNMSNLPEFSVYASEENPYGDDKAKDNFEKLGVDVKYNKARQT